MVTDTANHDVKTFALRPGKTVQWIKHELHKDEDQDSDPRIHITVEWTWWPA